MMIQTWIGLAFATGSGCCWLDAYSLCEQPAVWLASSGIYWSHSTRLLPKKYSMSALSTPKQSTKLLELVAEYPLDKLRKQAIGDAE